MRFAVLLSCLCFAGCTGIQPLDDLISPPYKVNRSVTLQNASDSAIEMEAGLSESSSDNRCEPYRLNNKINIEPGQSATIAFQMKCHTGNQRFWVNIYKTETDFAYASVMLYEPPPAGTFAPGAQVILRDKNRTFQETIAIAHESAQTFGRSHVWSQPEVKNTWAAWVHEHEENEIGYNGQPFTRKYWYLYVLVPKTLAKTDMEILIPSAWGNFKFYNREPYLEGNYWVHPISATTTRSLSLGNGSFRCDNFGCGNL